MHKHLGVRYVYEEGEGQRAKGEREMVELTPTDLAALPNEIYTELQQAVNTANLKAMQRLIERVQKQNVSLANTLTALVNQFRFDILQAVFNQNNS
jgi:TRAP-type mannitol/chloroaromatic compound transport system substrate-binding protein